MKLYYTKRSPYARKVNLLALEKNIKLDLVVVDLKNKPPELFDVNPLGKIPALITDDGAAYADSPVICAYLDSLSKPALIPTSKKKRFHILNIEGIADGIAEFSVAIFYQMMEPEEKRNKEAMEKSAAAIERSFSYIEKNYMRILKSKKITLAPLALAAAIGYLNFRLPEFGWQKKHKKLARWFAEFEKRESMQKTMPSM